MDKSKLVVGLVSIFITTPIWFYILYTLLKYAEVDRLVWFLYWIYLPASIIGTIIGMIIAGDE